MQHIQQSSTDLDQFALTKYSVRQRLLSGSLSLAFTGSAAATAALANVPAPTFTPTVSGGPVHVVHPVNPPIVHSLHSVVPTGTSHTWHTGSTNVVTNVAGPSTGANDINLASATATFPASSVAGFNQITLNIGGKQTVVDTSVSSSTKLTGAELVAAEQVASGGKQTLVINSSGIATGGTFSLNGSTVSALDGALKGNISGLDISKGVTALDTVSSLSLSGTLANQGKLDIGASGQTLDTISASNITNASGASISGVGGTAVALNASGTFANSGKVTSGGDLSISAPTLNNSGLLSSTGGNVNLSGGGGNLTVNAAGGTVKASNGNINLDTSSANGNITASGGNWISQNLNFNAGSGSVTADVDQVSGIVNATAGCAHITAATANLQLGDMNVSGDPTYYNTSGNISITGVANFTEDTAIVASGNIIGGGGTLNVTNAGSGLTLVAGANFSPPVGGTPSTNTSGTGDDSGNALLITDSTNAGLGSKTGGFIDISGSTLGGKGTPVTGAAVATNNGDITMIAYKGSASNSGSIVGTGTIKSGGANTINAGTGNVLLIGGGLQLTAQNITGSNISILAGTPTASSVSITNGKLTGSWSVLNAKPSNTAVNVTNINGDGNTTISTAGKLTVATGGTIDASPSDNVNLTFGSTNSTAKAPIATDATGLTVNGTTTTGSIFLNDTSSNIVAFFGSSTLGSGATFGLTNTAGVFIKNNSTVTAGTINISDSASVLFGIVSQTTGSIAGGLLSAGTINLTETGNTFIEVNTASNVLSANGGSSVSVAAFASSAKSLTVNTSSAFGAFTLGSTQTVNIKGNITATDGGDIDLTETGTTATTGISVAGVLTAAGKINLTTTGTDTITASKTITNANLTINAGGTVGGTSGLPTNVSNLLTVNGSSISNNLINIKDSGTGTLNVTGSETTSQPVTIVSVAGTVNVESLVYSGVTITDSATVAKVPAVINITPGAGNTVGDGTGAVKITAAGSITQTSTGGVSGSAITLTSTSGSIGSGTPVAVGGITTSTVTANATKNTSSVSLNAVGNINLNTGTSGSYTVNSAANSVNIIGTITANTKLTGAVTIGAPLITQGSTTAFLVAPEVTLTTGANGSIGVGIGAQSIQTKATVDLSIEGAAGSTAFVTQNGTFNLAAGSTVTAGTGSALNLFMAPGNTLTVSAPIAWDNDNITASNTVTIGTGSITGTTVGITAPTIVNNVAGGINVTGAGAAGVATFTSPTNLAINGTGTVTMNAGNSLNLSGTNSITLGIGGAFSSDPLNAVIKGGTLGNLSITSNGAFTGSYTSLTTTGTLSVAASSIRNGTATVTSFGLNSGTGVSLALNGAYTVSATAFDLTASANVATISASASGVLKVDMAGLNFNGTGNSIALKGSNINTALITDASYFVGTNKFANVSLIATSGTFNVGATLAQATNGIIGGVTATGSVTIGAPTLIVNSSTISGAAMLFNTANFKLNGTALTNSAIVGTGAGILTIASTSGLTISGTGGPTNAGGTYNGINSVTLQAATTGVNVGNLFTAANGAGNMLDNAIVDNITISAATSITLPVTLANSALQVASAGNIFLSASSIAYSPGKGLFLSLQAPSGSVDLNLSPATPSTSTLTLGKSSGAIDINVGGGGGFTVTSTGNVLVNETQSVVDAEVNGLNVTFNQPVTATGGLGSIASGSPISMITEAPGVILTSTGGFVGLSQGLQTMPTTALFVNSPAVVVGQGALNVQNNFNGSSSVAAVNNPLLPLTALNYVASSNTSSSTLSVGTIIATAGGINITNLLGTLQVNSGAIVQTAAGNIMVPAGTDGTKAGPPGTFESAPTMGGNIVLQNNDASGNIFIGNGATISALGTAASGLGNVFITKGTAPVTGLAAGTQPTPFPPLVTTSPGGAVFYTTTANPSGSITSGPGNQLKALGANIVFNGAGNSNYIQLGSGVTITADPPAAGAAAAAQPAVVQGGNLFSLIATASTSSGNAQSLNALSPSSGSLGLGVATGTLGQSSSLGNASQLPINNWSLPTTTTINNNLGSGVFDSDNVAAIGDSGVVSVGTGASGLRIVPGAGTRKVLTGGVSNAAVQTLENGATLLAPKAHTTLNTGFGSVDVAAGSVVMVMAFDGGLAVYNLHDTRSGAVRVTVGGNTVKLTPGQNAVMTSKQIHCFEEINPLQFATYRSMTAKDMGNGVQSFKSEFDIRSVLQNVGALRSMVKAQDSDTKKVVNSVLKTSAILSQLSGNQYSYMVAPPKTAMAVR